MDKIVSNEQEIKDLKDQVIYNYLLTNLGNYFEWKDDVCTKNFN